MRNAYTKSVELYTEITGIFYDVRELVTAYRGSLITLVIGIAIPIFNQNRNNPGMFYLFFSLKKGNTRNECKNPNSRIH